MPFCLPNIAGIISSYQSMADNSSSEVKGLITETRYSLDGADEGTGIPGVTLTLNETGATTISDINGYYIFSRVKEGSYTLRAEKPGYAMQVAHFLEVKEGHNSIFNFSLIKLSN